MVSAPSNVPNAAYSPAPALAPVYPSHHPASFAPPARSEAHPKVANPCPTPACRNHPDKKLKKAKAVANVAGLAGVALLLHQLPPRLPKDGMKTLLPADWKVWARVILGIGAVQQINKATDWKPKPWLGALEAIAVITPLAVGFSRNNLKQMLVMAPLVAGMVQGVSILQGKITKPIQDKTGVPSPVVRLGLSSAMGVISFLTYSAIYRRIARTGIIGKELKDMAVEGGSAFASATFATCARGCSPGSFICLGEMADIVGSLGNYEQPDVQETAQDAKGEIKATEAELKRAEAKKAAIATHRKQQATPDKTG